MNAIDVLNARFANREREFVESPYWDQREPEQRGAQWGQQETRDAAYCAMWARHLEWCDRVWPAPAGTGWEVTPPTGKEVK